jgi:hypothetical protein
VGVVVLLAFWWPPPPPHGTWKVVSNDAHVVRA